MAKTVIGLFDSFGEAQNTVDDLMRYGINREAISLVARDEQRPGFEQREIGAADTTGAAEGAGAGAVGGSLVGGALGLLVGTGLLVIPGIGPVLAAGPLAAGIGSVAAAAGATAIGAGLGAAAGGLLGGLMGAGVPEEDAHVYVEGVRRGGTLLTVNASEIEADDVRELMLRNGAVDIDRRAGEWRDAGWGTATAAGGLGDTDRKVVDPAYTDVDRTGEQVKSGGYASGHEQPREHEPQAFGEYLADDERNFRTRTEARADDPAYREDTLNAGAEELRRRDDLLSESGMRSERYAGADEMGGAMANMREGSGSSQPGRAADTRGTSGVRIYSSDARRDTGDELPAHGDFARGQREQPAAPAEPDFARGMHDDTVSERDSMPGAPHHGDFARGQRDADAGPNAPDFARGQRSFEQYDNDFIAHYRTMTGAGGQPYDYYKPGYQFGYDMANDRGFSHESWAMAEGDARQRWERDARDSWDEFKQSIRYGWEKARGLR